MSYCELQGSVVGYDGQTLQPGTVLKVFKANSSVGSIIVSDIESYHLQNDGTWTPPLRFERESIVYLHLNAPGFDRDPINGTPLAIPDTSTALLATIAEPVDFPSVVPVAVSPSLTAFVEDLTSTGFFSQLYGTGDPMTPGYQLTPISVLFGTRGVYDDSDEGNIFHLSSYAENVGTRPAIAIFGEGIASGPGSSAWGGNFVGYANDATGVAHAIEGDFGALVDGGLALGLGLNAAGEHANPSGGFIQMGAVAEDSIAGFGLRFIHAGFNPISGPLIDTSGPIDCVHGIDFLSATFSGAAFRSPGFTLDGNGDITSAGNIEAGGMFAAFHIGGSDPDSMLHLRASTSGAVTTSAILFEVGNSGGIEAMRITPDGDVQYGKALVALGGGATPTLGTIGGTGPASAAQHGWRRELDSTGAPCWSPIWK